MESWNQMGHTGNMIIKNFLRQMCLPLENRAYVGDGNGFNSKPAYEIKYKIHYKLKVCCAYTTHGI